MFKLFGFVKDTQQLNKNGVGLGLVISEQIVREYNGEMSFVSDLGQGSTFTFTFQLEDNTNSNPPNSSNHQRPSSTLVNENVDYEINQDDLFYNWVPNQLKSRMIDSSIFLLEKENYNSLFLHPSNDSQLPNNLISRFG